MRDACEAARKQLAQVIGRKQGRGGRHDRSRFEGNPRNSSAWGE
jgi:hypothetical protein